MRRRSTFILLGFVLATSGFAYILTRAESTLQENQPSSAGSRTMAGQMADQNSMQQMMRTMMSGVVPPGIKPGDLPYPSSEGAKLVSEYCVQCHDLPTPLMHAADEWPGIAEQMFNRMAMCSRMGGMGMMGKMEGMGMSGMMGMMDIKAPSAKEQEVIVAYLKKHSLEAIQPGVLPLSHGKGAVLFSATCAQCHALPDPKQHTAQQWPEIVARMRKNMVAMGKTSPDAATLRLITEFLEDAARVKP